jgi:hypothetical protein
MVNGAPGRGALCSWRWGASQDSVGTGEFLRAAREGRRTRVRRQRFVRMRRWTRSSGHGLAASTHARVLMTAMGTPTASAASAIAATKIHVQAPKTLPANSNPSTEGAGCVFCYPLGSASRGRRPRAPEPVARAALQLVYLYFERGSTTRRGGGEEVARASAQRVRVRVRARGGLTRPMRDAQLLMTTDAHRTI